ncbi:hypothetical protein, partial [Salmonella enterica]|uniref:hypothetical protein n=1 Tax=Salmonella enterica TaxID=28901 RepID=UPI003CFB1E9E
RESELPESELPESELLESELPESELLGDVSTRTPELSAVAEIPRVSPLMVAEASRDADGLEVPPPPDVDSGEL